MVTHNLLGPLEGKEYGFIKVWDDDMVYVNVSLIFYSSTRQLIFLPYIYLKISVNSMHFIIMLVK